MKKLGFGFGNKPKATRELEPEELDILYNDGYFSTEAAEPLQRGMWWVLSLHFGFRARDEARKLCCGGVVLDGNEPNQYLRWNAERGTKTRQGDENDTPRSYQSKAYATNNNRCPVLYYLAFRAHRPEDMCLPNSPFFLAIDRSKNSDNWCMSSPLGKNTLGNILTEARKKYNFGARKVANHSVRKTNIGRLLDSDISDNYVAQHNGMKRTESLTSYKSANKKRRQEMSTILSGGEKVEVNETNISLSQETHSSQSNTIKKFLSDGIFTDCIFNFGVNFLQNDD